jgi:transposase-like protein
MRAMITTSSSSSSLPPVAVTMDTKGRVRTSAEQRRLILAEFERSGLSAVEFAKRAGLKYSTLAAWVLRERRSKSPTAAPPLRLLEAVVGPAQAGAPSSLILQLPGGARLEVNNTRQAALAAELVRSLAKASSSPVGSPC